ncbi:unnamed protein product [Rotaria sp. Silwood2]|nr:unnamed protein product [Rotaria sp. Silwood2]CAF3466235.1 unnamed protein product [Rotaria sp. Silwood2]CAF4123021.1 unnamed protein product [Rotaria sp. Silwood2]CAF4519769.1 unnamed protein product [Rotaria sp. Silwood2]
MESFQDSKFVLHRTKFFLYITLQLPAVAITVLIFAFLLKHRAALKLLQNQALLVLMIINFLELVVDMPMPIHYYYLGYVDPATPGYCTWWTYCEYSLHLISELIVATMAIQRHALIFQANAFHSRLKLFALYYAPLALCIAYPIILYIGIIILYPCDGTQWDYTANLCGYANCYLVYNKALGTYDWTNNGLPAIVIFLANMLLIMRVVRHRSRLQQGYSWKKQRRMTLQLLSISTLYLIGWVPSLVIGITQIFTSPAFLANIQTDYTLDFMYIMCLFSPWIYIMLLPELTKWIKSSVHRGRVTTNTAGTT